ncbi:MAG: hypothetical protein LBC60_00570 [Spirochaetaceae bacterium]|jgi:hypothetical protein|nr:hypothetical protein [Spirochaetaceae bacterium]
MIHSNGSKNNTFDSICIKRVLLLLPIIGIAGSTALLTPAIRSVLIGFGKSLIHRQLDKEIWNYQLLFMAYAGLWLSVILLFILSEQFQGICIPTEQKHRVYTSE